MRSLDDITRDLARIQDELLALDDGDDTARSEIKARQDTLREEARRFADQLDSSTATSHIVAELKERRAQLKRLIGSRIDLVKQSSSGSGTIPDALPENTLNKTLMSALGAAELEERIAYLENLLEQRQDS